MPDKALDTADGKGEGNRANVDDNGGGLRFDLAVAKHFNHLTLRNGVALAGLGREPRDLEAFFATALYFVSDCGKNKALPNTQFLARLDKFLTHHARWLKTTTEELYGALCGCGLVGERVFQDVEGADVADSEARECFWSLSVASDVESVETVLAAWAEFDEARVRRRSKEPGGEQPGCARR